MSSNSTVSDASLLPPHNASSNSSVPPVTVTCFIYRTSLLSFTAFSITNIVLLLPLCTLIICLGLQQWWKQPSASTAVTSHSDVFTYHMVGTEMIGVFGCGLFCFGIFFYEPWMMLVGAYFFTATSNAQVFFHILTCMERYLAVVHPVTYLGLRNRGGVRVRNISICCVWLIFLSLFGVTKFAADYSAVPFLLLMVLAVSVVSFCSLSVLHVLTRPGPGEGSGNSGKVDKSKVKAFHTITAILGALLFRFGGQLTVLGVYIFSELSESVRCGALLSGVWFILPSSLVLPLLFLQRAGKLMCCQKKVNSASE